MKKMRDITLKIFVAITILALVYATFGMLALATLGETDYIELDPIEDLDLTRIKTDWEQNDKVSFENQGINVTLENKFTKIIGTITEMEGRDVEVSILVPEEYIKPSVLGNIKTNLTTITWLTKQNATWVIFTIRAHQTIEFEISKGSLLAGRLKKGVHDFWNYIEYNGDAREGEENVIVFIDKNQADFQIDNQHMIVQYKTDFWGWYYPVDDASSAEQYYYVDELGDQYRVVTHFKEGTSADIKIHAFPGAEPGLGWDSLKGGIARSWISLQVGVKKAIMDIWDPQPAYE